MANETPSGENDKELREKLQKEEERAQKKAQQHSAGLWRSLKDILKTRLSIIDLADPESTIEGIERDVEFKGFNVWILVFSIFIASIGLNVNSTAVVIGAMLISPLMGPIMGMGLSIGINDWSLLRKSLKSLGVAVGMALATSTIYFLLTPLTDASLELVARTKPTLLDVFVAFFGGLAGIMAGSRKEKSNVIPGVAIATALMPPLCTAGYGLASLQMEYFLGAFYLFIINTFFIGLSTVLVVRYLKFPVKSFVDHATEMKARRYTLITTLIIMIPSGFLFYSVVKETIFYQRANAFLKEEVRYEGCEIVKKEILATDSINTISVVMLGEEIPEKVIRGWEAKLSSYKLSDTKLRVMQIMSGNATSDEMNQLVEMFSSSQKDLLTKDETIRVLEDRLRGYQRTDIPPSLLEELQVQYPGIAKVEIGNLLSSDFNSTDTVLLAMISWQPDQDTATMRAERERLEKWLKIRLKNQHLFIRNSVLSAETGPIDQ